MDDSATHEAVGAGSLMLSVKSVRIFEAAVGLHFAYYNFVRRHSTLRMTLQPWPPWRRTIILECRRFGRGGGMSHIPRSCDVILLQQRGLYPR